MSTEVYHSFLNNPGLRLPSVLIYWPLPGLWALL